MHSIRRDTVYIACKSIVPVQGHACLVSRCPKLEHMLHAQLASADKYVQMTTFTYTYKPSCVLHLLSLQQIWQPVYTCCIHGNIPLLTW